MFILSHQDFTLKDSIRISELKDQLTHTQEALDTANKILAEHGLLGVLPNVGDYDDEDINP